jgi:acyl-CoA synthetase (NDP forming)
LTAHPPRGRRVGVVGDGGGHVALAADRLAAHGLLVEPFSDRLAADLKAILPATATTRNPVDIAGGGEEDVFNFERVVRLMAQSGEADTILLTGYFGGYSEQSADYRRVELEVADAMTEAVEAAGRPLIVQTMYPMSPTSMQLRRHGVPVYADIEAAAAALGRLAEHSINQPVGVPSIAARTAPARSAATDYFSVRRLLTEAGVPFGEARPAESLEAAREAAAAIGYPVVLKALGSSHKSDAGGVRLAIASEPALNHAYTEMRDQQHSGMFAVERMEPVAEGVELLMGVKQDRSFGPIALVGIGGLYADLFHDVAVALAPVTVDHGVHLIESLHGAALLLGWRGRPRLDVDAAARALSALSQLAAMMPEVAEIEVNPLLVLERGVLGLDARICGNSERTPGPWKSRVSPI